MISHVGQALTGNYAIVSEIVHEYRGEFTVKGFEFTETTWEGSPKLLRYVVFRFLSKRKGMTIDISFFPAREGHNGGFVVSIIKPENHLLNVEDYLKLHGRDDLTHFFTYRDPNTDTRVFAQSFFQMFSTTYRV